MKFLKFLAWSIAGLIFLTGLAYAFLPTIGTMLINQGLTTRGFSNVEITINRPTTDALTIPWLTFRTPPESGATSISIENTEITYSLDSLLNNVVENVTIGRVKIIWDSSLFEKPSAPSPSPPIDSTLDFRAFGPDGILPVLPFQHLHIKHVDISNPLAPPTLQQISLNTKLEALPDRYAGSVQLEGEGLLLNRLTFSVKPNGTASLTGTHTNAPGDPVINLHTSIESSTKGLTLHGQTSLKLHPVIHTLAVIYPLRPEYQAVTGTYSGTWTGVLPEQPSQTGAPLGPIQGEFTLHAHMPSWPPFAQDIQVQTQGTVTVVGEHVTVSVQPASSGSVNLAINTLIPPAVESFIRYDDRRSMAWNIREPIHVQTPIKGAFETFHIPSGKVHMTVRNSSEQLDMLLSSKGLLWTPASGVSGNAHANITTQLKPGPTTTWHPEELFLEGNAAIVFSPNQIAVSFNPSSYFRFSKMTHETIRVPTLISRFPQGAAATYLLDKKTLIVKTSASSLSLPSIFMQDQQWRFQEISTKDLTIRNTPQSWTINGDSTIKKVHAPFDAIKIPDSNWQARYAVNPNAMTVQFKGETIGSPVSLGGQFRLNLLTGNGSGTMTLKPIQFDPQTLVLSQLIQPWPHANMDVTHGIVSASAEVTFRKNPNNPDKPFHFQHLHGILDFKEIGGFFTPTIMEGVTTRVEIIGKDEVLQIPPTPFRIRNIKSAVGLTETSLLFSTGTFPQTSIPTLSITNMSTHLLGGTVSLANATINPKAEAHEVSLQVSGLDLNEILRLEQQEAVKGTGILDGTLPLFISRTDSGLAITVQQGSIQGRSPGGRLQFEVDQETAKSWTESQPQLDLLIKSLENYHYSKLAVDVNYQKNGILNLATQLEGKNPDFRNGVPIHFNLNIEENIPALMKSLSLVKGLEESIEKMMAKKNMSSTN